MSVTHKTPSSLALHCIVVVDLHSLFCFIYNIKINLQSKGKTNEGRCSSEKYGITKEHVGEKKISSKQLVSNIKIIIVVATILSTDCQSTFQVLCPSPSHLIHTTTQQGSMSSLLHRHKYFISLYYLVYVIRYR